MSKYIIDIPKTVGMGKVGSVHYTYFDGIQCQTIVLKGDDLEELNSDYINEHFGDLQDTAYQRGLEDGKAVNDKECEGCKYGGSLQGEAPCFNCSNYYNSNWTAQDDKIGVGDVVRTYNGIVFAVTKVNDFNQAIGFDGDGSTCRFDLNEVTKTGEHYNINEILGGLCDD